MARVIQIMEVTGEGLFKNKFVEAFQGLNDEQMAEIKEAYRVVATGSILDFAHQEQLMELAQKAKAAGGAFDDAELGALPVCWNGQELPKGTRIGIMLGDESADSSAAASFVGKHLKDQHSKERFTKAEGNKAFQGGAAADARKNIGQTAKPAGGVFGQKRQGPPRV